jgi:methylenetetrahydrofolate dehydrogenase (NADP+) / methenyltetrahydrofolate cyclohydrolase
MTKSVVIDGKKIASLIQEEIRQKVMALKRKPGLSFILVGDNPASQTYVRAKKKACAATGILSTLIELPSTVSQRALLNEIEQLNRNESIDGILVQLPLPAHIDERAVTASILPAKDVDGFHPINVGKMLLGIEGGFLPCTPLGIQTLLEKSKIQVEGKHVVIVGRSNIVGKPLAAMLMQKKPLCNATVTVAHNRSENLKSITRTADILIACAGKPNLITREMVREGAVVIDVGINRLPTKELVGDVAFEEVANIASFITPVPGGVGPMTIAMLLQNTLMSCIHHD